MKENVSRVFLQRRATGEIVEASLIDGITERQLADVESAWNPTLVAHVEELKAEGVPRRDWPQTHHWNWRSKCDRVRGILAYRGFAIECDGHTQGLMQVKTTELCRLPRQKGKPLVYVDYLEAAPWNQRQMVEEPIFAGVGTVMMAAAISLSREEGFAGRIGLHSLPQADSFYERYGLTSLGADERYFRLTYFEMTSPRAARFLRGAVPA